MGGAFSPIVLLFLTYRREGSSAKILFWPSKKMREFQNSLDFLRHKKLGGWSLEGINYLGEIVTEFSCREVLLEVGGVSLIQNLR